MLGFRLLATALFALVRKLPHLIAVGLLPTSLAVLVTYRLLEFVDQIVGLRFGMLPYLQLYIFFGVPIPFISWFGMNWHRVIVLSERPWPFPQLLRTHWLRYFMHLIALVIGIAIAIAGFIYGTGFVFDRVPATGTGTTLFVVVVLVALFIFYMAVSHVFLRLSLTLPSAAVGEPLSFRQSWDQTRLIQPALHVIAASILGITIGGLFLVNEVFRPEDTGVLVVYGLFYLMWIAVITEVYSYARAQNDVTEVFG